MSGSLRKISRLLALMAFVCAALISCDDTPPGHQHNWGSWTVTNPADCETDGMEERVCNDDPNHIETEVIPATGHSFETVGWVDGIAPDCTTGGTPNQVCQNNPAHTQTGTYVNPLGHAWVNNGWVDGIAPDCTTGGTAQQVCANDGGHTQIGNYTGPLGHDYAWVNQGNGTEKEICTRDGQHIGDTREIYADYIALLKSKISVPDINFVPSASQSEDFARSFTRGVFKPSARSQAETIRTQYDAKVT